MVLRLTAEHTVKCNLKFLTNILVAELCHRLLQLRPLLDTTLSQFEPSPNLATISLKSSFPRFFLIGWLFKF
jgi:hypothetical protein